MRFLLLLVPAILFSTGCSSPMSEPVEQAYASLEEEMDFNMDIRPLLSDRCYHCHGPDAAQRKAGLRLDTREGLFSVTASGKKAFAGGRINRSAAIERILSDDPELMMPPPGSNRSLSAVDKARLVKWVEEGARWKQHWAYIPHEKPDIPETDPVDRKANFIDAFVLARMKKRGLTQSPAAEKEQLLRRVTVDLTGVPPTIAAQDAFLADSSVDAYEKVVDRLLSTNAYAERMTLEWLDVARYADSHGFHADGLREMWPWRDWVIQAFRDNKPYDVFITEQLAGDLIPDATDAQIIATAFNRNHPMTAEGGVVDEEFRLEYVANRTNTLGTALLGLTLECARCHDHKFDPVSQKEYYQVSAFFNNVRELGMTGDDGDYGPMISLTDDQTKEMINYLDRQIAEIQSDHPTESSRNHSPALHLGFDKITKTDSSKFLDNVPEAQVYGPYEDTVGINGMALKFNNQDAGLYIANHGRYEAYEPFSVGLWVMLTGETSKTKVLIGNAGNKNNFWRGWDFYLDSTNHLAFRLISSLPHNMIHVRTNKTIPPGKWTHVMVSYDGSLSAEGVNLGINGNVEKKTVIYDKLYKSILPTNVSRTQDRRGLSGAKSNRSFTGDNGIFKGLMDEFVLYNVAVSPDQFNQIYTGASGGFNVSAKVFSEQRKLNELRKKRLAIADTIPELMVMEEMAEPREAYVLQRGEYDKPGERVFPGTPTRVYGFDSLLQKNRLGLSNWLFDPNHPLTARVAVNRYWQMIFGRGIVSTVDDFGSQGALPSHPELLDYLAVEFVESGWDVKRLLKTMVMSETYRQSSVFSRESYETDPENIWLSRGSSYRRQAELIRDNALASSGLMHDQPGGPSARPYQPDSLWVELGNFSYFLLYYHQDHDRNQYRKSMYTFVRRTSPPPNMTIFDAPNREVCTVKRERTNTPLQALVLLNDPQFVEASRALAGRLIGEAGTNLDDRISYGFRLVLSRLPSAEEISVFRELYEHQLAIFREDPSRANELLAVGDFKSGVKSDKNEFAALTVLSGTLYNMDEAYMKR